MKNEEWELLFLFVKREEGKIVLTEYKKLQLNKRITADINNSQQTTIIHNRQSHPSLSTGTSILRYNHPSLSTESSTLRYNRPSLSTGTSILRYNHPPLSTESSIFIYNQLNLHITNFIYILMNARMRAIQPDNDINKKSRQTNV